MDEQMQDRIDKYILNQMTDEERVAFESEMEGNDELKKQTLFTKALKEELDHHDKLSQQMAQWDKEMEDEEKAGEHMEDEAKPQKTKARIVWLSAIASIAALVVIGFFLFSPDKPIGGGDISGNQENVRGAKDDFADVVDAIKQKDFDNAMSKIKNYEERNNNDMQFYQECIDEKYKDDEDLDDVLTPEEAKAAMKETLAKEMRLKLLKAQVWIETGEKEKAINLLNEIISQNNEWKAKADSLLNLAK